MAALIGGYSTHNSSSEKSDSASNLRAPPANAVSVASSGVLVLVCWCAGAGVLVCWCAGVLVYGDLELVCWCYSLR